ncbi:MULTISPECIES: hypothetical protein [Citrobacter]|uniref:hypothetical protein n=1 Tax=Citrobacter TaxID=544 RepID=UPI000EF2202A|nr:hypothetical protein [Citrobacter pasteurii]AYL60982.1 hypothetical protein CUC49_04660 [Citrobacter pasteurii]HEM7931857.1 hypothetical protein [Citrobacter braakii]HEM7958564.1 hypothetical protein [Citrobacter braakii]
MSLKPSEFEEAEYRGPLFNQLSTSNLLWEPGQVFEKHIGIDHALLTTHSYLHMLHGHHAPLDGVVLSRYNWDYIWFNRRKKKKLPSFRLNVFIQAKRPQYGQYTPKALKAHGLKSPYWRFEVTPHQQIALEALNLKLKGRAIVCYACPVFHKEALLHKWTVEPKIVEHSTFPDVTVLKSHSAWNFSAPGANGVANSVPTPSEGMPLLARVSALVEDSVDDSMSIIEELSLLSKAVNSSMESLPDEASYLQARYFEGIRNIQQFASELSQGEEFEAVMSYSTVYHFCYLNRLSWLVAGVAE